MKKQEKHPHHHQPAHAKHHTTPAKHSGLPPYVPHIIAALIFLLVTFVFFKPMWLDGKVMVQSDIVHYKGVSKELQDYRDKNHEEALWTETVFSGMPAFQLSTLYNGNLLRFIDGALKLYLPHPSGLLFLAFVSFYILMVTLRFSPILSIGGAIAYGLSSYNLTLLEAGHNSKIGAIAYMPLVIGGVILLMRRKYLWGAVLFAIGLGLEIRSNHLQITYYLGLMLSIYVIMESVVAIKAGQINALVKSLGLMAIAAALAVASNTSLLWSTSSYVNKTIRGKSELSSNKLSTGGLDKDYQFQWSLGKLETMTLLIPDFYGGTSQQKLEGTKTLTALQQNVRSNEEAESLIRASSVFYWGSAPFTSGPSYLGAVICFLFVFGMFLVKDRIKWWLLAVSMLALMLAWGKNFMWFNDLFFYYFPGYNKFRAVSMVLVLLQAAFALLSVKALSDMVERKMPKEEIIRALKFSAGIVGGLCLIFALAGSTLLDFSRPTEAGLPDWYRAALKQDRQSMLQSDAFRSLVFVALAAGVIYLFAINKVKNTLFVTGMALLIAVDLLMVGMRYMNSDNFVDKSRYDENFTETPADAAILKDPALSYRVYNIADNNPFNDSRTSYFHKSVGGYSAAKLRRYQDLIENQLSKNNIDVLDMLNTKYVIVNGNGQGPVAQTNPTACGNAWFVDSLTIVENADEEMNHIGSMYTIQAIGNTSITVDDKKVTTARVGNHEHVKIGSVEIDPAYMGLTTGVTDTMGLATVKGRGGQPELTPIRKSEGATNDLFTITPDYRFNPRKYAIVDNDFSAYLGNYKPQRDSSGKVELTTYAPNHLVYKSTGKTDGFVVFSEIYYPDGWKCTVDGKDAEFIRVNYVLRGMKLAAGNHTIEFKFEPASFYTGEKIAMASSGLLLLLLLAAVFKDKIIKRKEKSPAPTEEPNAV